ncbi:Hypothetical predicted protein [Mytilus galloprovincialis]|uniref:L-Fucosyltransferase n=1 Tax=Mytilus galloprovincialis TaxID=29158 RepID=A0A8B6DWZ3_MYTGA|nr:Hypothetical predicted protein [Mytilus galloprovincialis]
MTSKTKPLLRKLLYLGLCILLLFTIYVLVRQLFDRSTVTYVPVPFYRREISPTHVDRVTRKKKGSICPILQGGLGNRLFQFSTSFAAARTKQMELIIPSDAEIRKVFAINVTSDKPKRLFISDGMAWSKINMPTHVPVEFISLGKREFDMATVVACDHTIMTIGTFGWWIGYLTGGKVVYVKDAAKKGSRFERILNFEDHFYPQWVGL